MLLGRAVSDEVGQKLLDLLRWWENYAAKDGETLDNNPSPGNKAGGLTTILEKSLGAAAKGGNSNLVEVYRYAEPVTKSGFVFMDTPGYDPVSVTGQVAGGANLICFTTGRGSCFGCKPAPSLKLATNTPMYNRMAEDMDINCGEVLDGAASVEEMGERDLQADPGDRLRPALQERAPGLRRGRVRPLASRRDAVDGGRHLNARVIWKGLPGLRVMANRHPSL